MILKQQADIILNDFEDLIYNGVAEGKTIEYKQDIPLSNDSDKKEFLYDISSFSNAGGGDLIAGISEDRATGLPESLVGIVIDNVDEFTRRVESLIRDGVAPRIVGLQISTYKIIDSNYIVLIRIPKSWNSPHQVIFKNADKFYTRATNGKYKLDVTELRNAFILSDTITERVRKFREDRISKIISGETPVPLLPYAKIIIQYVPINSFEPNRVYDLSSTSIQPNQIRPLGGGGWNPKFNLDGIISYANSTLDKGIKSYIQIFRNGIVETVNSEILMPYDGQKAIPSLKAIDFEKEIIESFKDYIGINRIMKIDLPVYAYITFIGVEGYHMQISETFFRTSERDKIDRDVLILPEIVIEKLDIPIDKILKPIFDMIWNACGFEKSLCYDNNDNRVGPR